MLPSNNRDKRHHRRLHQTSSPDLIDVTGSGSAASRGDGKSSAPSIVSGCYKLNSQSSEEEGQAGKKKKQKKKNKTASSTTSASSSFLAASVAATDQVRIELRWGRVQWNKLLQKWVNHRASLQAISICVTCVSIMLNLVRNVKVKEFFTCCMSSFGNFVEPALGVLSHKSLEQNILFHNFSKLNRPLDFRLILPELSTLDQVPP